MGFWGVLLELARVVAPHAAPHVARAVVDRAKERRAASAPASSPGVDQPSNQSLASAISYLEQRLSAAEERAAAAEERQLASESQAAERWTRARKLGMGLVIWNAVVTAAFLAVLVYMFVRR